MGWLSQIFIPGSVLVKIVFNKIVTVRLLLLFAFPEFAQKFSYTIAGTTA